MENSNNLIISVIMFFIKEDLQWNSLIKTITDWSIIYQTFKMSTNLIANQNIIKDLYMYIRFYLTNCLKSGKIGDTLYPMF